MRPKAMLLIYLIASLSIVSSIALSQETVTIFDDEEDLAWDCSTVIDSLFTYRNIFSDSGAYGNGCWCNQGEGVCEQGIWIDNICWDAKVTPEQIDAGLGMCGLFEQGGTCEGNVITCTDMGDALQCIDRRYEYDYRQYPKCISDDYRAPLIEGVSVFGRGTYICMDSREYHCRENGVWAEPIDCGGLGCDTASNRCVLSLQPEAQNCECGSNKYCIVQQMPDTMPVFDVPFTLEALEACEAITDDTLDLSMSIQSTAWQAGVPESETSFRLNPEDEAKAGKLTLGNNILEVISDQQPLGECLIFDTQLMVTGTGVQLGSTEPSKEGEFANYQSYDNCTVQDAINYLCGKDDPEYNDIYPGEPNCEADSKGNPIGFKDPAREPLLKSLIESAQSVDNQSWRKLMLPDVPIKDSIIESMKGLGLSLGCMIEKPVLSDTGESENQVMVGGKLYKLVIKNGMIQSILIDGKSVPLRHDPKLSVRLREGIDSMHDDEFYFDDECPECEGDVRIASLAINGFDYPYQLMGPYSEVTYEIGFEGQPGVRFWANVVIINDMTQTSYIVGSSETLTLDAGGHATMRGPLFLLEEGSYSLMVEIGTDDIEDKRYWSAEGRQGHLISMPVEIMEAAQSGTISSLEDPALGQLFVDMVDARDTYGPASAQYKNAFRNFMTLYLEAAGFDDSAKDLLSDSRISSTISEFDEGLEMQRQLFYLEMMSESSERYHLLMASAYERFKEWHLQSPINLIFDLFSRITSDYETWRANLKYRVDEADDIKYAFSSSAAFVKSGGNYNEFYNSVRGVGSASIPSYIDRTKLSRGMGHEVASKIFSDIASLDDEKFYYDQSNLPLVMASKMYASRNGAEMGPHVTDVNEMRTELIRYSVDGYTGYNKLFPSGANIGGTSYMMSQADQLLDLFGWVGGLTFIGDNMLYGAALIGVGQAASITKIGTTFGKVAQSVGNGARVVFGAMFVVDGVQTVGGCINYFDTINSGDEAAIAKYAGAGQFFEQCGSKAAVTLFYAKDIAKIVRSPKSAKQFLTDPKNKYSEYYKSKGYKQSASSSSGSSASGSYDIPNSGKAKTPPNPAPNLGEKSALSKSIKQMGGNIDSAALRYSDPKMGLETYNLPLETKLKHTQAIKNDIQKIRASVVKNKLGKEIYPEKINGKMMTFDEALKFHESRLGNLEAYVKNTASAAPPKVDVEVLYGTGEGPEFLIKNNWIDNGKWIFNPKAQTGVSQLVTNINGHRVVYKLHISALGDNYDDIMINMGKFLDSRGIAAKAAPRNRYLLGTSKQAGKTFTIYPESEEEFRMVADYARSLAKSGLKGVSPSKFKAEGANLQYEIPVPGTNNMAYYTVEKVDGVYISQYAERIEYMRQFWGEGPIDSYWASSFRP